MSKRVAVILSGCGFLDGAEIREAVLSLLYLDECGAEVSIFAPDIEQHHVVNHLNQEEVSETRNVLQESARIARGQIEPLDALNVSAFDALIIPGGYGVAKNLSDFAFKGPDAQVLAEFDQKVRDFHIAHKPIGAICIAPAVLARIFKGTNCHLTIGEDAGTAAAIVELGCVHQHAESDQSVVDAENKIASCSAYMREDSIAAIAKGIRRVVSSVIDMA
ncbi:MAG: isoprenoid biosynthesis glyoxalase ElbB [Rickettsiales bacterium]|nr:isoprenoid biosynthesis glyoxalase ElbB [Rickettsiales bacterium]